MGGVWSALFPSGSILGGGGGGTLPIEFTPGFSVSSLLYLPHLPFTRSEVVRLYKRFCSLRKGKNSDEMFLTSKDLKFIPELALNPLGTFIVGTLFRRPTNAHEGDNDSDDTADRIDFEEFARRLAVLHPHAKREDKLAFAFQVYDVDHDSFISPEDLFIIIKHMVGCLMPSKDIQDIVDRTIAEADSIDKDGQISFLEFKRLMFNADLQEKMSIDF